MQRRIRPRFPWSQAGPAVNGSAYDSRLTKELALSVTSNLVTFMVLAGVAAVGLSVLKAKLAAKSAGPGEGSVALAVSSAFDYAEHFDRKGLNEMLATKGMRFPIEVVLVCIRWYAAYPLSYRHLEEMMQERGVFVDHSSINRWAIRFLPLLEKVFRKHKRQVGGSWRMDETYIKVKGVWKYLYRAVDKEGKTVDFLLTANRDKAAALRFFEKAMKANGVPEKVTMDKSGSNKAAIDEINASSGSPIIVRQVKYLNNIVEQDHRAVKRVTKPMLNFKSFQSAKCVLAGIELMHMIRKGQLMLEGCNELSFADQFYALAGKIRPV